MAIGASRGSIAVFCYANKDWRNDYNKWDGLESKNVLFDKPLRFCFEKLLYGLATHQKGYNATLRLAK